MKRMHLRTRLMLLTTAFALTLVAITLGLTWHARDIMPAGLAIAWIVIICSFAAVQLTLQRVVRPLEDLVHASAKIATIRC